MKRLIYSEDAMSCIKAETRFYSGTYANIERAIDSAPTVEPKQVKSEWISVKDRLPVAKKVILAYESAFDSMSMAFRLPDTEEFINVGDYYALDAVTHWMPLPEPPTNKRRMK